MPMWAEYLGRWSHEQGQPLPYNRGRSFNNVSEGGPVDRVLPILVRRIARNVDLNVPAIQQRLEIEADTNSNMDRIWNLELAHRRDNETLLQALAETRAEVIELRVRQRVYERHLLDEEHQLAELRVHSRDTRHQ